MKIVERTMMEQELYSINENSNYIGNGDEFIAESVLEYLETENPGYTLMDSLYESIQYSSDYAIYTPLLEAADDIKSIESDLEHAKEIRDPKAVADIEKRAMTNVSKVTKWFLSIDPEKKGKVWHSIVMGLIHVLAMSIMLALAWISGDAIGEAFGDTILAYSLSFLTGYSIGAIAGAISDAILKKKIKLNMAEYNESLEKWETQINKLDDSITKFESMKAETDDPAEKKAYDKAISSAKKAKKANEDAIKKLVHLKELDERIKERERKNN